MWRTVLGARHEVRGGGWKHLTLQHAVENTWRSNVSSLAERIDRQVSQSGARVLVLAGEAQSRKLLRDNDGERAAGIATEIEHSGCAPAGTTRCWPRRLAQEIDAVLEPLRPHEPAPAAALGLLAASLPLLILVAAVFL